MIDINRLDSTTYCILVLWLGGRFTTSQIVEQMRVSDGTVKSACRDRASGGHLPRRRQFLTRGERQELLSYLKHYRMDQGLFNRGDVFTAVTIRNEPDEPIDLPDPNTKAGKRALREIARDTRQKEDAERREKADGHADRGANAYPLEWLYKERLLRDPEDISIQKHEKFSSEMRRHEAGLRLRKYLEEAQLGGFKEISMERAGSGSVGMSIPERFVAARSAVESIQRMMARGDYGRIVAVVHKDEFIWDAAADRDSRNVILETVRRALDVVSLFIGMMETNAFESRWGYAPEIERHRSREDVREAVVTARKIIQDGVRQS